MTIAPAILRALEAAGATTSMIIAAVEADAAIEEARKAAKRANNAERQRRFKAKQVTQGNADNALPASDNAGNNKRGDGSPKDINQTPSLPPKGSDADASGGSPPGANIIPISDPIELKRMAFRSGLRVLTDGGTPEAQARSMIGKWRRDFGDGAVLDVLARCHAEAVEQPIPWIEATLRNRYGRKSARPAPELDSNNALLAASLRALAADGRA